MAKRRKVIHVSSGKVYNTAAEAEREFGFPNSVLSEAIRLGKPCHGELFKFYDEYEFEVEDETHDFEPVEDNDVVEKPSSYPTLNPTGETKYNGSSTDKYAASEYFNSIGFDTEVVDGIVQFYGVEFNEVKQAVIESGYNSSWGCMLSVKVNLGSEDVLNEQ